MGMYTELCLNVELRRDTPKNVIDVLEFMNNTGRSEAEPPELPDHPFFETERWDVLFSMDSSYFAGMSMRSVGFDGVDGPYKISVRSNLKDYDDEIDKFLAWIQPYVEARSVGDDDFFYVGYRRDEQDSDPTLIYLGAYDNKGKQKRVERGMERIYTIAETLIVY